MLEQIVHIQLSDYFMNNKFLGPKQYCYKSGQNTQTALLKVIEDIKLAIEKRTYKARRIGQPS